MAYNYIPVDLYAQPITQQKDVFVGYGLCSRLA